MRRQSLVTAMVAGLVLVTSLPIQAQTTGRLRGTVVDSEGLALPGVTVTITSEQLIGTTRDAVTGETGAFRFPSLPPGTYAAMATLDGFRTETLEGLQVTVGGTATASFILYPESFTEAITVMSEAPLVDVTSSSKGNTFTAEFLENLPTQRNFYDAIAISPGISEAEQDTSRQVAFGSNVQSNSWNIDGIETSGPETGTSWVGVNPAAIEEIQVLGVGAPAEFGNMLGAAFNVVTKSGGNEFKGGVDTYWHNNSMIDSPNYLPDSEFPYYEQIDSFWDVGATLGGPIVKDRVWFFGAYEYWRDGHAFAGSNPDEILPWFQDRYDLKFSWRINDRNFLDVKGGYNDWGFPEPPTEFRTPPATAGEVGDDTIWGFNYQSIFSDRTFLEARYSGWKSNDDNVSQTGSMEAAFIDYSPPDGGAWRYSGGYWWPWNYDTSSDQFSVSVSHFADDFLKGDHDFKFGIQANQGDAITNTRPSETGTYYYHYLYEYDYYGTIYEYDYFVKVDGLPYYYGNEQDGWSVFVDDSWTVNDRLTLNLGLRFDHSEGVIPSFPRLDANNNPTGEIIPGVDPAFTWDYLSPRLGFAYNAGADRKTVIRGSFGVYYDGNVGGNWNSPPPLTPTLFYNASLSGPDGPFDIDWGTWSAGLNNVDPDLEAPRSIQYSLGFERELKTVYSFGVLGVYKETTNQIGWEFLDDGIWEEFQWTDPFNGRVYTFRNYSCEDDAGNDPCQFPTTRKGNGPGYTADGFKGDYYGDYWAVILTFNRRFTDWWGMQASYTYSESTGINPRALDRRQNNPLYGSKEGSNPNQWFNVDPHNQQGDRTNMFRVQANFELPFKLHAATAINLQDGRPYSRQIVAPYETSASRQDYFAADYSLRFPSQTMIDFSIGRSWGLPGDGRLKTDLQFFNLLNDDATDRWQTMILAPGEDFVGLEWVKPRRLMLRIGVEY